MEIFNDLSKTSIDTNSITQSQLDEFLNPKTPPIIGPLAAPQENEIIFSPQPLHSQSLTNNFNSFQIFNPQLTPPNRNYSTDFLTPSINWPKENHEQTYFNSFLTILSPPAPQLHRSKSDELITRNLKSSNLSNTKQEKKTNSTEPKSPPKKKVKKISTNIRGENLPRSFTQITDQIKEDFKITESHPLIRESMDETIIFCLTRTNEKERRVIISPSSMKIEERISKEENLKTAIDKLENELKYTFTGSEIKNYTPRKRKENKNNKMNEKPGIDFNGTSEWWKNRRTRFRNKLETLENQGVYVEFNHHKSEKEIDSYSCNFSSRIGLEENLNLRKIATIVGQILFKNQSISFELEKSKLEAKIDEKNKRKENKKKKKEIKRKIKLEQRNKIKNEINSNELKEMENRDPNQPQLNSLKKPKSKTKSLEAILIQHPKPIKKLNDFWKK